VDNFVSVHNLFNESPGFSLVHLPHFTHASVVTLLETFELFLQFFELLCELAILLGQIVVLALEKLLVFLKLKFHVTHKLLILSQTELE